MEQDNKQSMTKKTLIYLAGNFSSKIFALIIIPIYAEYLSAFELGQYDFQLTIANLLTPVIGLAIWESILRFGLKAEGKELQKIFSTASIISFGTLAVSFLVLVILYNNLYGFNTLSFLYVLLIIMMPMITILGYMARALKANKQFAVSGVLSSFVNLIGILIFVIIMKLGVKGLLISTVLGNIFNIGYLLIATEIPNYLRIDYYDKQLGRRLIKFSVPLIFNLTFGWFVNSFSRFYINVSLGAVSTGIYAFASKFSGILMQFAAIVNMTAIEDAILSSESEDFITRFERNISDITTLFFKICFVLLPVIALYYNFVDNTDFKSSLTLVPILLLVALFNNTATLIGNVFPVYNKTSTAFLTSLIAGVSNIVLSIIFGHLFRLIGICLAQLFSITILVITRYILGNKIVEYKVNWLGIMGNVFIFIIISLLLVNGNYFVQSIILLVSSWNFLNYYRKWLQIQINKVFHNIKRN